MGIIAGAAALLSAAVGTTIATISVLVASIVTAAAAAISAVVATIITSIGGVLSGITTVISSTTLELFATITTGTSNLLAVTGIEYVALESWVSAVYGGFQSFLTAIHFTTLMNIHQISYLLSAEYRSMMDKVFMKLGEFSNAVGMATGFMETAIQIGRKTSLEVSSFLGKSFDVAEIVWLKDLQGLLGRISDTAAEYEQNPSRIWQDIDELIVKPATNAKAKVQQGVFTTVESLLGMADTAQKVLTEYKDEITGIIGHLPEKWRNEILPRIDKVYLDIQTWQRETYNPALDKIGAVIDVLNGEQQNNRNSLRSLIERIAFGGDLLAEIDKLPETERIRQERIIGEIATRETRRQTAAWTSEVEKHYVPLQLIIDAMAYGEPSPKFMQLETAGLRLPIGKQTKRQGTWFVGDY